MYRLANGLFLLLILVFLSSAQAETLKKVTLQLQWKHQFEFAGHYAAIHKGFYARRGLDVQLREYKDGMDLIDEVLSGRAQYATNNSTLIQARLKGKPVKLLANYFKRLPLVILSKPPVSDLAGLRDKRLMASTIDLNSPSWKKAFAQQGLQPGKNIKIVAETFTTKPFIEGEVDAMSAYITNEPFYLEQQGIAFNIIDFSKDMRNLGDVYLFSSEAHTRQYPQQTQDFIEASNEGWRYALDNKEEIVELILTHYNSQQKSRESLLYEAEKTHDMILPMPLPIGSVFEELISEVAKLVLSQNGDGDLSHLNDFIFKAIEPGLKEIELTDEERAWIKQNPRFQVGAFPLDPYIMKQDGRATGYMVELLQAIARQVGLEPEFHFAPLKEILQGIREGSVDASMALIFNKEREKFLYHSQDSITIYLNIFARKDATVITDLESLSGKTLASYESYSLNPLFQKFLPDTRILMAKDIRGMFELVTTGEADALIQEHHTGNYLLRRWLITNLETKEYAVFAGKLNYQSHYYGVGRHSPMLASILDKSHRFMPEADKQRLWNDWISSEKATSNDPLFSAEERAYLDSLNLKRGQAYGWIPFNFKDESGVIIGIIEDHWALLRDKLGLTETTGEAKPFAEILDGIQQKNIDFCPCTTSTKEHEAYAVFSDSYEQYPIAIACKHSGFITNPADLEGKTVAVGRNYSAYHLLKNKYPGINFLQVENTREALEQVNKGKAYAAVDILPSLQYQIEYLAFEDIRIAGVTDVQFPLQVMVGKQHSRLIPLINRAIAAITPQERAAIQKKWMMRDVISTPDYSHLWQVLGIAVLVISIILFWNRRLAREVAQRKKTEKALHESDTRYRLAMDATQDGVWDWNVVSGEVNYSSSWRHILGDNINGNDYATWKNRIHPDDSTRILKSLQSHLDGETPIWAEEHRLCKSDNSWAWVLGRGKVVKRGSDGTPLRMLGTMTNINVLKQAEDKLSKLAQVVEQSQESVVITNLRTEIEYVNQSFLDQTGYSKQEVLGKKPSILQSGKTSPEIYKSLWDALKQGQPWKGELVNKAKNGTEYIEYAHITPLIQSDGSITHYVAVKEDITEKKKIARELDDHRQNLEKMVAERTEQLEIANQSKSDFLANMSHEIRTPMNAVLGLAYLLSESNLNEQQRDYINKISGAGKALLAIINDILDFSKIEAGRMELDSQAFSLQQLVDNVTSIIQPNMTMNKAILEISNLPEGIDYIRGDALRLQQILINFLSNAAKFTEQGKVWLDISVSGSKPEKQDQWVNLRFTVKDTGIGIPEQKLADIFNAFSQEDASITRKFGGTGLGLAICSQLVDLMKGQIGVNSEVGQGSEFWVVLPFKLLNSDETHDEEPLQKVTGQSINHAHILVVDDSEINREVVNHILILHGATVTLANNGQQAIDLLHSKADEIDLVLMDIQMPVMDGLQATRIIRKELSLDLPIIALSAGAFTEQEEICLSSGMNGFLAKPVDVPQLLEVIQKKVPLKSGHYKNTVIAPQTAIEQNSISPRKSINLELPGLDISVGLKNWQDEILYRKYLGKFVDTYSQSCQQISDHINIKEYDQAAAITHKLKGVAGNLGMSKLSHLAGDLNDLVKSEKEGQNLTEASDRLSEELQLALESITQYLDNQDQLTEESKPDNQNTANAKKITAQLHELLTALEVDNPDIVKPLLSGLQHELGRNSMLVIVEAVEEFDFNRARVETRKMLDDIGA